MRYKSLKTYLDARFGHRVNKISLDAGLTCPNRDGTISDKGCLFCDPRGSGTGAFGQGLSIKEQLERGLNRPSKHPRKFIAYFQSYTNTYAPYAKLRKIWSLALEPEEVVGLAIGTRPDCLTDDVLDLLADHAKQKEVWLELGLQSASDHTLRLINRGHRAARFAEAVQRAKARNIKVLAHVIIGLPGEGEPETIQTAEFITKLRLDGVKIHSLYVSKGTGMADLLARGEYHCLTLEEYIKRAVLFLENIPSGMVIHRLTGDPDPATLIEPPWALNKQNTLESIRKRLEDLDTWQGAALGEPRPG